MPSLIDVLLLSRSVPVHYFDRWRLRIVCTKSFGNEWLIAQLERFPLCRYLGGTVGIGMNAELSLVCAFSVSGRSTLPSKGGVYDSAEKSSFGMLRSTSSLGIGLFSSL